MPNNTASSITVPTERYDFAHALRGIAALAVVVSHFVGVFWTANPETMKLIGLPAITALPLLDPITSFIAKQSHIFGMFGVGMFFVISGFVISFSVERESQRTFFIRRLMRIYPAYIAGFSIVMALVLASATLAGRSPVYSLEHVATHTLIFARSIFGFKRIDGISWTLEVELVFYLLMLAFGARILTSGTRGLATGAGLAVAISIPILISRKHTLLGIQISCGLILISGIAYAMHCRSRITTRALIGAQCAIALILSAVWTYIASRSNFSIQWLVGFLLGMATFAACYALWRDRKINSRILTHFADISYPLYVVHAFTGYIAMYWTLTWANSPYLAIAAGSVAAYLLALAIHKLIEMPFIDLSRRWTRSSSFKPVTVT